MNGEKLYEAIGLIDDKYLIECENAGDKKKRLIPFRITAGIAAAACFCVITAGALLLPKLSGGPTTAVSVTCEAVPEITSEPLIAGSVTTAENEETTKAPVITPDTAGAPAITEETTEAPAVTADTTASDTSPDSGLPDTEPSDDNAAPPASQEDDSVTDADSGIITPPEDPEEDPVTGIDPGIVTPPEDPEEDPVMGIDPGIVTPPEDQDENPVLGDYDPGAVTPEDDDPNPAGGSVTPVDEDDLNLIGGGSVEVAYGAPILPLTLLEADSDITAKRNTVISYSEWDYNDMYPDIIVTDEYILTNSSAKDKEVTVIYPIVSNGAVCGNYLPTLTVNGENVRQSLRVGSLPSDYMTSDGDPYYYVLNSWDRYKKLLSDGGYLEHAMNYTFNYGDRPVTVYRFTDMWTTAENKPRTGTLLGVSFSYDPEKTKVVTRGLGGSYTDPETGREYMTRGIAVDGNEYDEPAYIIVTGEDITDFTYDYFYCTRKHAIDYWDSYEKLPEGTAGAEFVRYETDYDHIMRELLDYLRNFYDGEFENRSYFQTDFESFYLAYCEYLENRGAFTGGSDICELLYKSYWLPHDFSQDERVFYTTAQVTVPAGGSVNVTARSKDALVYPDFCSLILGTAHGYEIAATLGSNLEFTEISAEITDYSSLDVVDENFGFDLENGAASVKLDPGIERYYIEARKKYPPKDQNGQNEQDIQ